jgi:hypothetical protein
MPPSVSPDAGSRTAVDDKKPSPAGHGLPAVTALRLHTVSRRTTDDARRWIKEQLTVRAAVGACSGVDVTACRADAGASEARLMPSCRWCRDTGVPSSVEASDGVMPAAGPSVRVLRPQGP